jgi:predicted lipoprotein with Yx(FWY)xxD motif
MRKRRSRTRPGVERKDLLMNRRLALLAAVTAGLLAVSGCASSGQQRSNSGQQGTVAASVDLSVTDSPLGDIVVDGDGMTVYVFDEDTAGADSSACTGECAMLWPAVTTTAGTPEVVDVTGTVGTITGTDGDTQLTLNGLPLHTYLPDARQGDMTGQGVDRQWWVVSPSGEKITAPAPTPSPRGY